MTTDLGSSKENIETLNGIINSLEKEILDNQIAFDSIIKQCFDRSNTVCQNPDSVVLEQDRLVNEFNRISVIIQDEMKVTKDVSDLLSEYKQIEIRLQNMALLVQSLSDFRVVYEQLVSVEQLLHEEKLDKVVSLLKDNEEHINHLQNTNNQHLLALLSRVNKRKLFYVQGILMQLLHKRVVISDHSISICTQVNDPLEPYSTLSLRSILSFLQQVSSFDIAVRQELSLLRTFADHVLTTNVSCKESIENRPTGSFALLHIIAAPSTLVEKGVYPEPFLQFLTFMDWALLELNDTLKDLFTEQVYVPMEAGIVQYIKSTIPKDIRAIGGWKDQLANIERVEDFIVSNQYIEKSQSAISPLIQSLEWEWIRSRQNYYFAQFRNLIIQNRENVGIVDYDCHAETEKPYCFDFRTYGGKNEKSGFYELFSVDMPSFSPNQQTKFENDLSIGVCKIYSNYISIIHLLHDFINEGVSLETKEVIERYFSVFKEFVHLALIKAVTFSSDSISENCYMFNNLSVLLYHLFVIPYKYHEKLAVMSEDYYVCVEEIPHIRDLQHVLYNKINKIIEEEIPPLIMAYQDYENTNKADTLKQICDIRNAIRALCGDAYNHTLESFKASIKILVDMDTPKEEQIYSLIRQIVE